MKVVIIYFEEKLRTWTEARKINNFYVTEHYHFIKYSIVQISISILNTVITLLYSGSQAIKWFLSKIKNIMASNKNY